VPAVSVPADVSGFAPLGGAIELFAPLASLPPPLPPPQALSTNSIAIDVSRRAGEVAFIAGKSLGCSDVARGDKARLAIDRPSGTCRWCLTIDRRNVYRLFTVGGRKTAGP